MKNKLCLPFHVLGFPGAGDVAVLASVQLSSSSSVARRQRAEHEQFSLIVLLITIFDSEI